MDQDLTKVEPIIYKSKINVPYNWWAGDTASRFFSDLCEKKISGTRCGACKKVFVPPRKNCPYCGVPTEGWVTLAPEGELVTFTVARRKLAALPVDVPAIFGLIRLSGADTALLHYLGEVEPDKVRIGMKVVAKFAENPEKNIRAIEYFRPA